MRTLMAYMVAPFIFLNGMTGFSKRHRQNDTLVYLCIDTIKANAIAGRLHNFFKRNKK